ncbi:EthD family reductase [Demetria terragena]|uniref:EthD family reductase n=1 Tax=Demetria terragena TaxID=63959 RepID=UPI00035C221C|nr:EthD family reductase [Demetria terragena]
MIKVSVLYPRAEGARFDHDYYRNRHVPWVAEQVGEAVRSWGVERGLSDGGRGEAPFVASCWFVADSVEAWNSGFGPVAKEVLADIANYTDVQPVMQVSEITSES